MESKEGAEAVGVNVPDPWVEGGKHTYIWPVLQGYGPIRTYIWVREVGLDDPSGPDRLGLTPQGGPSADAVTSAVII